jgi:Zn-dependent protease with chaperone function
LRRHTNLAYNFPIRETIMASDIITRLRHPKEDGYGIVMMIFGSLYWLIIIAVVAAVGYKQPASLLIYAAYAIGFILFMLHSAALYKARIFGNYVLIGPEQFPHLHRMVQDGAASVGITPTPTAFLYNSNGLINAFARRLLGGRYIFLTSALVEADTDEQVKFVIGHELGHHAAGHLNLLKNIVKGPAHFIPFLGPAYARSRELTCDRVGAYLCNDQKASRTALTMLACGCRRLNSTLNCDAFEAQEKLVPPFWGWVLLIFSRYPRTTQRSLAVSAFFTEQLSRGYETPNPSRDAAWSTRPAE